MSSFISKELFAKFKSEAQEDADRKSSQGSNLSWKNPEPGKEYRIRLLPDKAGHFYKKYFYHMYQINGESWKFSICPKTFDPEAFCPNCAVTAQLYKGSDDDKKEAQRFKRKEKFITNALIVKDPRDVDKDDDQKVSGTVKLYEFPSKVEQLIRSSMNDSENGVGIGSYDPKEGFDFILKVDLTKKDGNGKQWPTYETSTFARQQTAVADSDKEIQEILDKTVDISEHLKKQLPNEDDIVENLKAENVFSLIEETYNKKRNITKLATESKSSNDETEEEKPVKKETPKVESSDEMTDDELLAELNSLGK